LNTAVHRGAQLKLQNTAPGSPQRPSGTLPPRNTRPAQHVYFAAAAMTRQRHASPWSAQPSSPKSRQPLLDDLSVLVGPAKYNA
jgi:hypothetical protein